MRDTEQIILETAEKLFSQHGIDNVSVRVIASKANVNIALINYYFRSKENLIKTIIDKKLSGSANDLMKLLNSDMNLFDKINTYVEAYIKILIDEPDTARFYFSILISQPDLLTNSDKISSLYKLDKFYKQINAARRSGQINPDIHPQHFYINMISMIIMPFLISPLISDKNELDNNKLKKLLSTRKREISNLLFSYLKPR